MIEINEKLALEYAADPTKIIDPLTANSVISYLNGYINDLNMAEFELELKASQYRVDLLKRESKIAISEAEWKISQPYLEWRKKQNELKKFRAWRNSIRNKEEHLKNTSAYLRNNYPRAIE